MSVRGAIAWRAHVKLLQRDDVFDSVTADWYEGGSWWAKSVAAVKAFLF